jgi:ABC-2 type transport system ATP-binding protein
MADPMIVVEHLRKVFGQTVAVDDVSFTVAGGSVLGLLGPNGAGKTTIINCLTTLLLPDRGRATVGGRDVVADPAGVRSLIAVTGQFAAVDEMLTGRENLVLFARLLRLSRRSARDRADELLARFDIADAADRPVGSYSGGMRRRLDLALSLVVPTPVLFLDEPTTGLDPRSRLELWAVVRQLREAGTCVLLTTQYLDEADQLADRILVIDHGRVVEEGDSDELKRRVGESVCAARVDDAGARTRALAALRDAGLGVAEVDGVLLVPARELTVMTEVVRCLDAIGVLPDDLQLRRPSLDDVFLALTGHAADGTVTRQPSAEVTAR